VILPALFFTYLKKRKVIINSLLCCLLSVSLSLAADEQIKISADSVEYTGLDKKIIEAKGKVLVVRLSQSLSSDSIIYNTDTKVVTAIGNIKFTDKNGSIVTAESMELDGDFKKAIIENLEIKTQNGETIRAVSGKKIADHEYILNDGFYTPCSVCENSQPIWSLRANKVDFDDQKKHISYADMKFYLGKIPVIFLPYLSHETKGAKRESGFLRLNAGHNSTIGSFVKIPYYFNLASDRDATITLIPTSKSGYIFEGEYRQLTDYGSFLINPIFTKPRENVTQIRDYDGGSRFSIRSSGYFTAASNFSVNYSVNYTSDKNFLRTYNYSKANATKSHLSAEYFENRNYFVSEMLYFQNLREGQTKDYNPIVLPHLMGYYENSAFGNINYFNSSDFLYLSKKDTYSLNRISLTNGLKTHYYTAGGHYFSFKGSVRADMYSYYTKVKLMNKTDESDQNRIIPEFHSQWSYPNYGLVNKYLILMEPIIQLKVLPNINYNKNIYNEDSKDSEFSFSNLFSESKFSGLDLVEKGSTLNYGIKSGAILSSKTNLGVMLGQSYSTKRNHINYLEDNKDYIKNFSDYVGLFTLKFNDVYIITNKIKLDHKKLSITNNETGLEYRTDPLNVVVQYSSYRDYIDKLTQKEQRREELNFEIGTRYIKDWYFSVKARNNLNRRFSPDFKRGIINMESNITYFYDCIGLNVKIYRDFTNPVGTKPVNGFTFHIILKNIND
jgi:LPS-assembly protein